MADYSAAEIIIIIFLAAVGLACVVAAAVLAAGRSARRRPRYRLDREARRRTDFTPADR